VQHADERHWHVRVGARRKVDERPAGIGGVWSQAGRARQAKPPRTGRCRRGGRAKSAQEGRREVTGDAQASRRKRARDTEERRGKVARADDGRKVARADDGRKVARADDGRKVARADDGRKVARGSAGPLDHRSVERVQLAPVDVLHAAYYINRASGKLIEEEAGTKPRCGAATAGQGGGMTPPGGIGAGRSARGA